MYLYMLILKAVIRLFNVNSLTRPLMIWAGADIQTESNAYDPTVHTVFCPIRVPGALARSDLLN